MLNDVETVETRCGISAIGRPCQMAKQRTPGADYPLHSVCKSPSEKVHFFGCNSGSAADLESMVRQLGFEVARHTSLGELCTNVANESAGCVILDAGSSDGTPVELFRDVKRSDCSLPIILLSGSGSVKAAVECMRAGAENFICKPVEEEEVQNAVKNAIAKSRMTFCRISSGEIALKKIDRLTPAEFDVARLLAAGHLTKKIAAKTNRSESTVKIHRARIMQKLAVSSPATIVHLFNMAHQLRTTI